MNKSAQYWNRTNAEIAREEGVHPSAITRRRKAAGVPPFRPYSVIAGTEWEKVDWAKPNKVIAREMGQSVSTVIHYRMAADKRSPRIRSRAGEPEKQWTEVDWTEPNTVIAMKTGRSVPTVSSIRGRYFSHIQWKRKEEWFRPYLAKLSERKTVHEWLNMKGIPTHEETGKPMCLLRRLSVALGISEYSSGIDESAPCTLPH